MYLSILPSTYHCIVPVSRTAAAAELLVRLCVLSAILTSDGRMDSYGWRLHVGSNYILAQINPSAR